MKNANQAVVPSLAGRELFPIMAASWKNMTTPIEQEQVHPKLGYRAIERYRWLLERGLREIHLTYGEAGMIVDSMNGTSFDSMTEGIRSGFTHNLSDCVHLEGWDKKWEVDWVTLKTKLENASDLTLFAIVDAAERFWEENPCRDDCSIEEEFKRVGLIH